MSSRIQVIARVSGRRRWTEEQKLAVLRDAFGPNGCVRTACERHEVGSGLLYTWRKAVLGKLAGIPKPPAFAEVQISNAALLPSPTMQSHSPIGIELPTGVRLTVDGSVNAEALSRVLGVLAR
jgi:transposase